MERQMIITDKELEILNAYNENEEVQQSVDKLLKVDRELPFEYNGITTQKEKELVANATIDIYSKMDIVCSLIEEIVNNNFPYTAEAVEKDKDVQREYIDSYDSVSARLHVICDYIREVYAILDLFQSEPGHIKDVRTQVVIGHYKNILHLAVKE